MSEDGFINIEYVNAVKSSGVCVWQSIESVASEIKGGRVEMLDKNVLSRVNTMTGLLKLLNKKYSFPLPDNPLNYDNLVSDEQKALLLAKRGVFSRLDDYNIKRFVNRVLQDKSDPVGKALSDFESSFKHLSWTDFLGEIEKGNHVLLKVDPYTDNFHIFHISKADGEYIDMTSFEIPFVLGQNEIKQIEQKLSNSKGWNAIVFSKKL